MVTRSVSLKPEVILHFADGEFLFRLNGKEIEELQKVCGNVGFAAIYQRINLGVWLWGDLYNVARLGLIGGGMGAVEAKQKCDFYIGHTKANYPLLGDGNAESIAKAVINAAMHGFEDLPPGEAEAPKN